MQKCNAFLEGQLNLGYTTPEYIIGNRIFNS